MLSVGVRAGLADGCLQGLEIVLGSSVAAGDLLGLEVVRSSVGGSVGLANGNSLPRAGGCRLESICTSIIIINYLWYSNV